MARDVFVKRRTTDVGKSPALNLGEFLKSRSRLWRNSDSETGGPSPVTGHRRSSSVSGEGPLRQGLSPVFGQAATVGQIDLFGVEIDVGADRTGLDLASCHRPSFRQCVGIT
jgi:hypothetical protein